jgi:hypothetical protein
LFFMNWYRICSQEIPQLDTLTLKNGLKIYLLQCGQDSMLSIRLVIDGGRKDENECEVGYSEVIRRLIYTTLNDDPAEKKKKRVKCQINGGQTLLNTNCNRNTFSNVIAHLSSALVRLSFRTDKIDTAVSAMIDKYKAVNISSPRLTAVFKDLVLYGADNPLGRNYCAYQVQRMLPIELVEFYQKHYTPDRTSLIICGDLNVDAVKKTIKKYFLRWKSVKRREHREKKTDSKMPDIKNRDITFIDKFNAQHCIIKWIRSAPSSESPDHPTFLVAVHQFNRFLQAKVKAHEAANNDTLKFGPVSYTSQIMEANCTAGSAQMAKAINFFDTTLKMFGKTEVTRAYLEEAVNNLRDEYRKTNTPQMVLSFYDPLIHNFDRRKNLLADLSEVKVMNLQLILKNYFNSSSYKLIIVGQEDLMSGQLDLFDNLTRYKASDFETCNKACREIVITKCHCEICYKRGKCYVWRFKPNQKKAIKKAMSKAPGKPSMPNMTSDIREVRKFEICST